MAKKGDKYKCEECGLIVLVEDPCGCEPLQILCCGAPMKPVKEAAKKQAKEKAKAKKQ
ncbi:MAG: desulforedoxin [Candidatus Bathyarchaeota archaeon]|nr:desulforedoxin [Candidatus Bathyarchaeota archaeon]